MISKEHLREIVKRILTELEAEEKLERKQQKIYMLCTSNWDTRFPEYLKKMVKSPDFSVYPVIPISWKNQEYENILRNYPSCGGILYRSYENQPDLEQTITVLPVVPRDVVVKTALCIADTYETHWISSCIEVGSKVIFDKNGLVKFTGKEPEAYKNQILSYYRTVLTYGINICGMEEVDSQGILKTEYKEFPVKNEQKSIITTRDNERKRVITASNIERFATDGVVYINNNDIVTDLALDRAKFLNIILKEENVR